MPLRIASHWVTAFNIFVEFPDDAPPTPAEVESFLSEDILSMEHVGFHPDGWKHLPSDYLIDLGWYPGGDPDGAYRLCLLRGNWDDVPVQFEHRNCYAVQKAIDKVIAMLANGSAPALIARVLADPRFWTEAGGPVFPDRE